MIPGRNHKSLALIVCGTTSGKTLEENGDYVAIFQRFLQASAPTRAGFQYTVDPYDVFRKQEYPAEDKLDDYDGIIITGSRASSTCFYPMSSLKYILFSLIRLRQRGVGQ